MTPMFQLQQHRLFLYCHRKPESQLRLDETLAGDPLYAQGRLRRHERSCACQKIRRPKPTTSQVSAASTRLEHILDI